MRTRPLLLTAASALVVMASIPSVGAQPATAPTGAARPTAAVPATPAPAPEKPAAPEVVIKETEAKSSVTKSTGRDTLSVDFPDEDIRNILRNVADLFELNIIIPEALQGKATIKLRDVSWRQIFQSVLTPVGFTYIEDGNIIKVVSNESLTQEPATTEVFVVNYARASDIMPTVSSLVDAAAGGKIVVDARTNSLIITERPTRLNRIRPIIEQLDRATDQVMIESKFVEVTDRDIKNIGVNWASLQNYQLGVGNISSSFDRLRAQQSSNGFDTRNGTTTLTNNATTQNNTLTQITNPINSSSVTSTNGVVTSTSNTAANSSINNNNTTTGINEVNAGTNNTGNILQSLTNTGATQRITSALFSAADFNIILSALQSQNNTKVVSNPTIVTLNNTEATINVGEEDPIPKYNYNQERGSFEVSGFEYKQIGIILKVTPQVNGRGDIKLTLAPEVSQKAGTTTFGGAGGASIPILATRKAVTSVSIKDGYTMAIGGLMRTEGTKGQTKVPVLGSLPGVGRLFRSDSKDTAVTNLIIFITAKSVSAEGAPVEQIMNSGQVRQLHLYREELPGYRDGSDPFEKVMPMEAPGSAKSGGK